MQSNLTTLVRGLGTLVRGNSFKQTHPCQRIREINHNIRVVPPPPPPHWCVTL